MAKLPKNFPEYLIMYKTLTKKIHDLENEKDKAKTEELIKDIQKKINQIKIEVKKIEDKFPENFFDNNP